MSRNFSDPDEPYARLRRALVYKDKPSRTPPHLAGGRGRPGPFRARESEGLDHAGACAP